MTKVTNNIKIMRGEKDKLGIEPCSSMKVSWVECRKVDESIFEVPPIYNGPLQSTHQ